MSGAPEHREGCDVEDVLLIEVDDIDPDTGETITTDYTLVRGPDGVFRKRTNKEDG